VESIFFVKRLFDFAFSEKNHSEVYFYLF